MFWKFPLLQVKIMKCLYGEIRWTWEVVSPVACHFVSEPDILNFLEKEEDVIFFFKLKNMY